MDYDLMPEDRSVGRTALDILDTAVEAAEKACNAIGVPILAVAAVAEQSKELRRGLNASLEKPSWSVAPHLAPTLRVGLSLLIEKLEKVAASQVKLGVTPDDTALRLDEARGAMARAMGQMSLGLQQAAEDFRNSIPEGGSVTISSAGHDEVTIHGRPKAVR